MLAVPVCMHGVHFPYMDLRDKLLLLLLLLSSHPHESLSGDSRGRDMQRFETWWPPNSLLLLPILIMGGAPMVSWVVWTSTRIQNAAYIFIISGGWSVGSVRLCETAPESLISCYWPNQPTISLYEKSTLLALKLCCQLQS